MGAQKWQQWAERKENLAVLRAWKMAGLSDEEIARRIGISRSTLAEWKRKHEAVGEALSSGKDFADSLVENSLFRLTQGYTVALKKAFKVKKPVYDEHGKKIADEEVLEEGTDEEYVKPDVRAMIFWLQNRKPDAWRKQEEDASEESAKRLVVLTPDNLDWMREAAKEGQADGREEKDGKARGRRKDSRKGVREGKETAAPAGECAVGSAAEAGGDDGPAGI